MTVAWHEVPGIAKASIRPVGYGVRGSYGNGTSLIKANSDRGSGLL
jgi:hypothetical protein